MKQCWVRVGLWDSFTSLGCSLLTWVTRITGCVRVFEESSSISSLDPLQIVRITTLAHSHLQLPTVRGREEGFWVNLLAQVEFQYVLQNESVHVYDVCEFVDAGHSLLGGAMCIGLPPASEIRRGETAMGQRTRVPGIRSREMLGRV